MRIKKSIIILFTLLSMVSFAQNKVDLSELKLNEDLENLLKEVPNVRKGEMFENVQMFSYGFDNKTWTFRTIVPFHIELLSYNGKLSGYAFQIKTFEDQEIIKDFMLKNYKNAAVQESKWLNVYTYKDKQVFVELRAITQDKFNEGANGYFSIKNADFYDAYEQLVSKH